MELTRDRSQAMTRKFFFFSEMGYNAYPIEALEQYGYSAFLAGSERLRNNRRMAPDQRNEAHASP
jgi:hypothetical protein